MQNPVLFALAVLGTPGPTNTLLATAGLRRSLPLIPAEAAGYTIAVLTLGPVVAGAPLLAGALRAWWACTSCSSPCDYGVAAVRSWRRGQWWRRAKSSSPRC